MTHATTADLLEAIIAATRRIVEVRERRRPLDDLARLAGEASPRAEMFKRALARPGGINVIAECKRRSPSRGMLRANYDVAAIAKAYADAGAAAISVLTEPTFFDGALEHLHTVRATTNLPVLRKDFIISEYQLYEARAAGADAVLLIVAALDQVELPRLLEGARRMGLAALVEVHSATELERAVEAEASIVGVNNRNLRTLEVDVSVARDVVARIPRGVVRVAESGLRSADDLRALKEAGYDAFLIGEQFMTAPSPGEALREMVRAES